MRQKSILPSEIKEFQQRLYREYKKDLSLPEPYQYLYGNPVEPVVPLDTTPNGIFVIGAYPSSRFAAIQSERDVPIGDNCGPFSTERYFDGTTIRTVDSGNELEHAYLQPLELKREQCWITDIVRLFLFKEGHIGKYRRLGCPWPAHETRSQFEEFAREGFRWLVEELTLAQPKIVITLGSEVAGILQKITGQKQRNNLLDGEIKELIIDNACYPVIHFAHPGIVMRPESERNPWPGLHKAHISKVKIGLRQILESQ